MRELWTNGIIWLSSPEQAALINAALWASLIFSLLFMMAQVVQRRRFERQQLNRLEAAAKAQARLAVFESWLHAGGWVHELNEVIYESRIREYREMAMKHGEEYFAEFCEELEVAQVQLDLTLASTIKHYNEARRG